MAIRLKGDILAFCSAAFGAAELIMRKSQCTQISSEIEVPQIDIRACVNVHPEAARTATFLLGYIKGPSEAVDSPAGFGCTYRSFCIVEEEDI